MVSNNSFMTAYTIRLVHGGEERRVRFLGSTQDKSLMHDLNERLDEVAFSCPSIDHLFDWTVEQMELLGFSPAKA